MLYIQHPCALWTCYDILSIIVLLLLLLLFIWVRTPTLAIHIALPTTYQ